MTLPSDDDERAALDLFQRALDAPSTDRLRFIDEARDVSPAVRARAAALAAADSASDDALLTGGAVARLVDITAPDRVGSYKVVRLIGAGGMGAVFLGRRDAGDFDQIVAIKVIRKGLLSDAVVERFERERTILASLTHPGVARLYDGGALPDGSPFMIMEFVDGSPVTTYADANSLTLAARVALVVKAAEAIGYAHRNLVVHRDVTPANVLVTRDGEVKVIDFGIARPYEDEPDADDAGARFDSLSHTPGFAAPERLAGARATTLVDIFSLGRLLEALTRRQGGGRELRAIIAKATRADPADRYQSTDDFIQDLQALTLGEPVDAYGGGVFYRFGKFVRRQRVLAGAAALAFLSLTGGLAATTALYQRAEEQRRAADTRFSEVRALASFMLFELYDDLEKVTGATASREKIASKARTYLDSLYKDERASRAVRLEAAVGDKRLADILGNPTIANLGRRDEFEPLLTRAIARLDELDAASPDDPAVLRALADAHFSRAIFEYIVKDSMVDAHEAAKQSAALYGRLAEDAGPASDERRLYIRASMLSGPPLIWDEKKAEGVAILRQARKDIIAYRAERPDDLKALRLHGSTLTELARALERADETPEDPDAEILEIWDEAVSARRE
ncbi:MAG: serine/threonine-protein kinase, partial [Pseudomonadota bacterium]